MAYTQANAITQTRRHLKDATQNVWTDTDIKGFINEAIDLIKWSLPLYFTTLVRVSIGTDVIVIPQQYEILIPLYVSARCFEQDEQYYRASQKMNEFEVRKQEMLDKIMDSDDYTELLANETLEYVSDIYSTDYDTSEDEIV